MRATSPHEPPDVSRPHHTDPVLVGVVAVGGALGTAARYGLNQLFGPHGPVLTLGENLLGAFLLGALLEGLVRVGTESRSRRVLRLGVGTGVLGGFTTYSTFALELQRLGADGQALAALGYGVGSVALGFTACLLGVLLAARRHRAVTGPAGLPAAHRRRHDTAAHIASDAAPDTLGAGRA